MLGAWLRVSLLVEWWRAWDRRGDVSLAAARGYRVAVNYRRDAASAAALVREIDAAGALPSVCRPTSRSGGGRAPVCRNRGAARAHHAFRQQRRDDRRCESARPGECGDVARRARSQRVWSVVVRACRGEVHVSVARWWRGAIVNVRLVGAATLGSPGEWVWYAASKRRSTRSRSAWRASWQTTECA